MTDRRVVETENLKKVLDAILKKKKKKEGQYEEKIIHVCVKEFDLNQEEVLTSLKKAVDDSILKIVNKNKLHSTRNSFRWRLCHRESNWWNFGKHWYSQRSVS